MLAVHVNICGILTSFLCVMTDIDYLQNNKVS